MKKRQSKYCKCKIAIPNYKEDNIICNRCNKIINVKIRKFWKMNPFTKIEKNKKKYNRKRNKGERYE